MLKKKTTTPSFIDTSPNLQQAIKQGEERLTSWLYNVEDRFKPMTQEEIKAELKRTAFPFAVLMENFAHDFNISSLIRNCNAMNCREMFYVGDKKYDKRGACGVFNYSDVKWLPTVDDLLALKSKYKFVGFDNGIEGAKPMSEYTWEPETLIIFGSEGVGLSDDIKKLCDEFVYIEQFGSVRSMNVATASGIAMNDIVQQFRKRQIK